MKRKRIKRWGTSEHEVIYPSGPLRAWGQTEGSCEVQQKWSVELDPFGHSPISPPQHSSTTISMVPENGLPSFTKKVRSLSEKVKYHVHQSDLGPVPKSISMQTTAADGHRSQAHFDLLLALLV